jgi:hypothetical protein
MTPRSKGSCRHDLKKDQCEECYVVFEIGRSSHTVRRKHFEALPLDTQQLVSLDLVQAEISDIYQLLKVVKVFGSSVVESLMSEIFESFPLRGDFVDMVQVGQNEDSEWTSTCLVNAENDLELTNSVHIMCLIGNARFQIGEKLIQYKWSTQEGAEWWAKHFGPKLLYGDRSIESILKLTKSCPSFVAEEDWSLIKDIVNAEIKSSREKLRKYIARQVVSPGREARLGMRQS